MGIGTSQVEVELVERRFAEEVGTRVKGFQIVELVFDEAVDGLDVTLVGVGARRDALMLGSEVSDGGGKVRTGAVGLKFADELPAIVGLPSHVLQVDAAAPQVDLNALGEQLMAWAERWEA